MYKTLSGLYKQALLLSAVTAAMLVVFSCSSEDDGNTPPPPPEPELAEQTVFMYMPWSENNIYKYFLKNIDGMKTAIAGNKGPGKSKVLVYIAASSTKAALIELKYNGKACVQDTLRKYEYTTADYTTAKGIASILNDVKEESPTKNYGMIIGCHGMGWLPKGTDPRKTGNKQQAKAWGSGSVQLTRFFGAPVGGSKSLQTDISTLAEGIRNASIKMDYILFDDCYMSNIETAYELRDVASYLIASTSEIMMDGMPYAEIGKNIIEKDFKAICDGFHKFYSNYSTPCGTIAVTDCSELERTAEIMKRINALHKFKEEQTEALQKLDGLTPAVFFDFGDYVKHLCTDKALHEEFSSQLSRLVPYSAHTEKYYSTFTNDTHRIETFAGLTISDPTANSVVAPLIVNTEWYKATH